MLINIYLSILYQFDKIVELIFSKIKEVISEMFDDYKALGSGSFKFTK